MGRRTRHLAEYLAFRTLVCLVLALPWRVSVRACEGLGWFVTCVLPRRWTRYRVARENLERSLGPLDDDRADRLIRGMWTHLFRMVVEILQLPRKVRLENSADVVGFRHRDEVTRALCSGRPVLLLTGHFGNWELANRALGMYGFRMGVVARTFDNPYLDAWFARYRENDGHRVIPKVWAGPRIAEVLSSGGIVGLLCDQDAGRRGMFVDFLGRPASTHKSIALLALEYGAVIVVTGTRRLPDDLEGRWSRFEIGCEAIIDPARFASDPDAVRSITAEYTAALERAIRRTPEQYFWVHRRWKSTPLRRRERERLARERRAA